MWCKVFGSQTYRFEELTNLIKTIRNAMKIRDMAKCLEEFEQLCRAFLKSKNIVDKEGVPSFYIRLLADLEDYLNQVSGKENQDGLLGVSLNLKMTLIFLTALGGQGWQEKDEQK